MVDTMMILLSVTALPDNRIWFAFCEVLLPTVILDHDGDAIRALQSLRYAARRWQDASIAVS
jgi:hypothetical protein